MGTVDDYLATLAPSDADAVARLYAIAREEVPEAEQGLGYGMPALVLDGKPLLSVMRTRKHVGVYPFSSAVVAEVADDVARVPQTSSARGTLRFQPEDPLPDDVVRRLVRSRRTQIRGA